jgi:hypothetical protein
MTPSYATQINEKLIVPPTIAFIERCSPTPHLLGDDLDSPGDAVASVP